MLGQVARWGVKWFTQRLFRDRHTRNDFAILANRLIGSSPEQQILRAGCELPYSLATANREGKVVPSASQLLIVTGRFRSGSTLLWRAIRELPEWTAYYEPLNPRRWFDEQQRGDWVDPTHRQVADYWKEYQGLEQLGECWDDRWDRCDLWLSGNAYQPQLAQYLKRLVGHSGGNHCLQFNRADFRLAWLRNQFPSARIVQLVRHPRDQWCSTYQRTALPDRHATLSDLDRADEFYLRVWQEDLARQFPVLSLWSDAHPYQLSYAIWVLAYHYGAQHRDVEIRYEDFVRQPQAAMETLFEDTLYTLPDDWKPFDVDGRSIDRWESYADENWFSEREHEVDELLAKHVFAEN